MSTGFRRAVAAEAKPLIGLYSESGTGKTYSALLIAKGFTNDMSKVGAIETESGRGEAYADDPIVGGYNVLPLREDFSPKAYGAAIVAAEKAGLQVLIVDSASHEWESHTGVLGMAAANQEAGKKGPLIWQNPKLQHGREFMLRLTQTPIPLVIVCMRAKYLMEEAIVNGKKEWVRSKVLAPKQSEDILYEMFVHGWIDQEHRFRGTKYTLDPLRKVFIDGEPISVQTGERLAAWCAGRLITATNAEGKAEVSQAAFIPEEGATYITDEQVVLIETACSNAAVNIDSLKKAVGVRMLAHIKDGDYQRALDWVGKVIEARDKRARNTQPGAGALTD